MGPFEQRTLNLTAIHITLCRGFSLYIQSVKENERIQRGGKSHLKGPRKP